MPNKREVQGNLFTIEISNVMYGLMPELSPLSTGSAQLAAATGCTASPSLSGDNIKVCPLCLQKFKLVYVRQTGDLLYTDYLGQLSLDPLTIVS